MRVIVKICVIVIVIFIPLTCILGAGVLVSRMPDFYSYEFSRLNSIEEAGISIDEDDMAALFSNYINGRVDTFQIVESNGDEETELFIEKEQLHMADVKRLIDIITIVFVISCAISVAAGWTLIYKKNKFRFRRAYFIGVGVYAAFIALLIVVATVDFTSGFDVFHEIFFTNDLWMLDPDEDVLLMIMPEQFFKDAAFVVIGISALVLAAAGYIVWRLTKERKMFYEN